ncbi:MAG TPA: hypothetical protein VHG89_09850 [Verrucomicrobiae bacterium]|nr:hypothetical protein [Verrucomicrobiae bacterium]
MSKSILSNGITFVFACIISWGIWDEIAKGYIYVPMTLQSIHIHRAFHPQWFWFVVILNCCIVIMGFYISITGFIKTIKKAKENKHRISKN